MTGEPAFRTATKADTEAVLAVARGIWSEMGEGSGFTQEPTVDGLGALSAGEGGAVFLCELGGAIRGFALLTPDLQHTGEAVMGVWLLPEARGKGAGRELALMATEQAREAGYKRLRGLIPKDNEPALSFFSEIASLAQMVGEGMEYELPL